MLLNTLYTGARDKEKKQTLHKIIQEASNQRAAFANSNSYDTLDSVLNSRIFYTAEIIHLEKKLERLEKSR
jgi:hypothetical protein